MSARKRRGNRKMLGRDELFDFNEVFKGESA